MLSGYRSSSGQPDRGGAAQRSRLKLVVNAYMSTLIEAVAEAGIQVLSALSVPPEVR
jgi:hypothetical protein